MTLKKQTIKNLRQLAAKKSITMPSNYDKRFKNSWLHILGEPGVEPVERKQIVHVKKEPIPDLGISWADIAKVINA